MRVGEQVDVVEDVVHELADPRARFDVADHLHGNTPYSSRVFRVFPWTH